MKIAIVKLSALGDIVHAMIVLQFIKKHNEEIKIDWIVEENYRELLDFHPHINKVHVITIKKAKKQKSLFLLFNNLNKVRKLGPYDLVIDMQGLIKSAIISRLIHSKVTLGFDKLSARESIASIFYNKTFNYEYHKNVVERNYELIKFAFAFSTNKSEIIYKSPFLHSRQRYSNLYFSSTKKNILLIPGASNQSKCYPVKKLAELTLLFDANYFVIWGNPLEEKLAFDIKKISPNVNICEKLSTELLISLISQVDLVIGPDTGPTHIAWALNKPSITLYGPTPGKRNSYITNINKILESDSKVNPYKLDRADYSIKTIKVKEIINLITKYFS